LRVPEVSVAEIRVSTRPFINDDSTMANLVSRIRAYDQRRASFPGEHFIVAALGSSLLRSAARRRSGVGRLLTLLAGGALLARAASGRDGLARLRHRRHVA
jgi:hypothetical protein